MFICLHKKAVVFWLAGVSPHFERPSCVSGQRCCDITPRSSPTVNGAVFLWAPFNIFE